MREIYHQEGLPDYWVLKPVYGDDVIIADHPAIQSGKTTRLLGY